MFKMKASYRLVIAVILVFMAFILGFLEISFKPMPEVFFQIFSFLGWVGLGFYVYLFYREDYQFILSSFYQFFYFFGMMISSMLVSSGFYMYEIQRYGVANGVFWLVLAFAVMSYEFSYLGYRLNARTVLVGGGNRPSLQNSFFITSVVYFVIFASAFILLRYGSPWSYELTRVQYWGEVAPGYLSFIRILLITSFLLVAANYLQVRGEGRKGYFQLLQIFLYIFFAVYLLGEKFSVLVMFAFMWLIAMVAHHDRGYVSHQFRRMVIFLMVALIGVGLVYEAMGLGYGFIMDRVALQAQVLWSVMEEGFLDIIFGVNPGCSFDCFFALDGRDFATQRYLPALTYELSIESGTTLSGLMPSIAILLHGLPTAIILHFIFSFVIGIYQRKTVLNISVSKYMVAYLSFVVYFFLLAVWYVGNFQLLIPAVLVSLILLVFSSSKKLESSSV